MAKVEYKHAPLHSQLDRLYKKSYHPRPIHYFFVNLSKQLKEKTSEPKHPIILTTNYDCVLECTFQEANQSFDLLYALPLEDYGGKFAHVCFDSKKGWSVSETINDRNGYSSLKPYYRPLIIKLNGTVNHQEIINKEIK